MEKLSFYSTIRPLPSTAFSSWKIIPKYVTHIRGCYRRVKNKQEVISNRLGFHWVKIEHCNDSSRLNQNELENTIDLV